MKEDTISLCMIVKNEETTIERCLNSVMDIVDEIIIVDTGSTDQTIRICEKYTEKIYPLKWNGNFAEARNYSIKAANGTWIFWLDADEELDRENVINIKEYVSKRGEMLLLFPIYNYIGKKKNEDDLYKLYQPRLFRNGRGITFQNKIHETLYIPEEEWQYDILDIPIHHYGYLQSVVFMKNKHDRNLEILLQELKQKKHSPWIEYHLASEYYSTQDFEKAFHFVNLAIIQFIQEGVLPPSIVYRLKYSIILESENINGAWPSINHAIQLYPDYVDLHYVKAEILFRLEKYEETIEVLDHCLQLGEDNDLYFILKGTGSFRAAQLKEKCLEKLT